MRVEIVTPENSVYEGDVSLIQLPGVDGLFELLENHAPMIAVLSKGTIKLIEKNNSPVYFSVNGGVVEVLSNKALVLAEGCHRK
jgi:F-type H+-transporting ATPase subunit epsilon